MTDFNNELAKALEEQRLYELLSGIKQQLGNLEIERHFLLQQADVILQKIGELNEDGGAK